MSDKKEPDTPAWEQLLFGGDRPGYFGAYGGAFLPEILRTTLDELTAAFDQARSDPAFWQAYTHALRTYSCRPTPLTLLENLSAGIGGGRRLYLK
ncbi:MAG TPA: hypothetical protein DIC52_11670, partial [Candidatus Latescibacteria bacterium]|nr:hypothetical protein [Candidatus Latescibacterota bacterium]